MWTYVWVFNLIALINVSIFMIIPCCFITIVLKCNLQYNLRFGTVISTTVLWVLFYFIFSYSGVFMFSYEAENWPFKFCEEISWIFARDFNKFEDCFFFPFEGIIKTNVSLISFTFCHFYIEWLWLLSFLLIYYGISVAIEF